jgi:putative transposase
MNYYVRNLPHWQPPGKEVFITWRLRGSLPANQRVFKSTDRPGSAGKRFLTFDRVLDQAGTGPLWLKDQRVAECVVAALKRGETQGLFSIHTYIVMANHVHVLLEPAALIAQITQIVKGGTAREANRILGLTGNRFWQDESFDHWIRNPLEWSRVRSYIEQNPVTAGLVQRAEEWPWSSAARRRLE